MFEGSPYSTTAVNGITPPIVVNDMQNFMLAYLNWATNGFPTGASNNVYLTQKTMINDMCQLCGATLPVSGSSPNLNFTSGACTNPPVQ